MSVKVNEYIESHWDECVKNNRNDEPREDGNVLLGLPYPYTVPAVGHFNELYYWDTYFTNLGLLKCGRAQLAKNNVDNMLYLVNKYGFMPNGNTLYFLSRSQPPFLSEMVKDVYEYYNDKVWLTGAFSALEKEYKFWSENRTDEYGLSTYGGTLDEKSIIGMSEDLKRRTGVTEQDGSDYDLARHSIASCESGWDMNPRWEYEGYNYYNADLNSLLYLLEKNMAYFAAELDNGQQEVWNCRAEKRQKLMNECMINDDGLFYDYNFKSKGLSKVFSAASFYPLYAGLATKEQAAAAVANLNKLEAEYGILTCEKNDAPATYQWNYPNGWACIQYVVIRGLLNYGYEQEAKRLAAKYITVVERAFDETGNLWEKYNVIEGNVNVSDEYKMPPMMGWSAGVYLALQNLL